MQQPPLSISLSQFQGYNYAAFLEFLTLSKHTSFEIILNKNFSLPQDEKSEIIFDYFDALFIGQKLSELSNNFGYFTPNEFSKTPFHFQLDTDNYEKLAETLEYIIQYFDDASPTFTTFVDEMSAFWTDYCDEKLMPVCHGLLIMLERNLF